MSFFNNEVISVLKYEGISVTNQEIANYIKACKTAERANPSYYKTKKDLSAGRRYSIFHTPVSGSETQLSHWLVLPGLNTWGTKNKATAVKLYVNIQTGERKFVKIRRPSPRLAGMHIVESIKEETNNMLLHIPVQHYSRYSLAKGTKAYLFQPYRGSQNLLQFIRQPNCEPKTIINMLLTGGEVLDRLHQRGFLHTDFKPENIVISDDKKVLSLVDVEFMMTILDGEKGKRSFHGTKHYQHADWVRVSEDRFNRGLSVYYSTKNDVFSYLVMAEAFLAVAFSREVNPDYRKRIQEVWIKTTQWQNRALKDVPDLSSIMREIQDLTVSDPELIQANKMRKSCFRC